MKKTSLTACLLLLSATGCAVAADGTQGTSDHVGSSTQALDNAVTLFENFSFDGRGQSFGYGEYDGDAMSIVGVANASSASIAPGYRVILYANRGFSGRSVTLSSSSSALSNFNDRASSMRVTKSQVEIFSDNQFGGASRLLGAGRYDINQLGIGNDQLSSLKVPFGFKVTLYSDGGFSGNTRVFKADAPIVGGFNDQTSSIVIEDLGGTRAVEDIEMYRVGTSGMCLDIYANVSTNGSYVDQWPCKTESASGQTFSLKPTADGFFNIVTANGKCFDVLGAATNDGATVGQWDCGSQDNQKFSVLRSGDGRVSFQAKHSGKCVGVANSSTAALAGLTQTSCVGSENQVFEVDAPPADTVIHFAGNPYGMSIPQFKATLQNEGFTVVSTGTLSNHQCTVVYADSNMGSTDASAEFGLLVCANELTDGLTLTSKVVYGGCDLVTANGGGSKCEIGVLQDTLAYTHSAGFETFTETFKVQGPSADYCAALSLDMTCAHAGANVASTGVSILDDHGNGVGTDVSIGVDAGVNAGVDNGAFSASFELVAGIGLSASFSFGYRDDGEALYRVSKQGWSVVNGQVFPMVAGNVVGTWGNTVSIANDATGKVSTFGQDFGRVSSGLANNAGRGIVVAGNTVVDGVNSAGGAVKTWSNSLASGAVGTVDTVANGIGSVGNAISNAASDAGNAISHGFCSFFGC